MDGMEHFLGGGGGGRGGGRGEPVGEEEEACEGLQAELQGAGEGEEEEEEVVSREGGREGKEEEKILGGGKVETQQVCLLSCGHASVYTRGTQSKIIHTALPPLSLPSPSLPVSLSPLGTHLVPIHVFNHRQ